MAATRAAVVSRLEAEDLQAGLQRSLTRALSTSEGELQALMAANLIEESSTLGAALPGLASALRAMAVKMPEDPTAWLCARLKASRPVVASSYTESVLKAHVMKSDEFQDIHILKNTPRPHPQAWNFRRTDAGLPVFGVGQCHYEGIAFLVRHLKQDLGFQKVMWFNMREEPVVFLDGQACAPRTACAEASVRSATLASASFFPLTARLALAESCFTSSSSFSFSSLRPSGREQRQA